MKTTTRKSAMNVHFTKKKKNHKNKTVRGGSIKKKTVKLKKINCSPKPKKCDK